MTWLALVLVIVALLLLVRGAGRQRELFFVRVKEGHVELVRGRLPPSLLEDIADVVRMQRLTSAEIRARAVGGHPELDYRHDGSGRGAEQPLRNVLGRFTVRQIRDGRRQAR